MRAQEIGKPPVVRFATARHRGTLVRRHARDGDGQARLLKGWR